MDEIIQLKITLAHTKPSIWRRILVDKQTTFFELHHIIQIAMGWQNYHLFEFKVNNYRIGEPDDEFGYHGSNQVLDAKEVTLDRLIIEHKEEFRYEYDFGDSWSHKIVVEKFLTKEKSLNYPHCIDGKLNCPPEDCGGIPGFYNLIEIMENKKHPERKEMLAWLGAEYDPEVFNKEQVNKTLELLD